MGLKEIEWLASWGRSVDKALASLDRSGRGTFVDAYRRVKCADGSTWYAKANIYKDTGVYYELQLPRLRTAAERPLVNTPLASVP